jgi:MFS family permease
MMSVGVGSSESNENVEVSKMKCPKCGSEYYSSASTCYACSQLERDSNGPRRERRRRVTVRGLGSAMAVIGAYMLIRLPDLERGIGVFAAFPASLVALGIMVLAYGELYSQTSLREYRKGRELSNRMAAILIAVGIGLMVFSVLYVGTAASLGFGPDSVWAVVGLMPLSNVLIAAGLLRRPKRLFATEENEEPEMSVSKRRLVGGMTVFMGFAIEATAVVCFDLGDTYLFMGYVGVWLALLFGPAMIFTGVAILSGPMMRPWKQGSTKGLRAEERSDEAD